MLGRTLRETIGEEIGLRLTRIIGHVLETGCAETCEYSLKVPAGTRWFQGRARPYRGVAGPPGACLPLGPGHYGAKAHRGGS
jgi:hypothetical protein